MTDSFTSSHLRSDDDLERLRASANRILCDVRTMFSHHEGSIKLKCRVVQRAMHDGEVKYTVFVESRGVLGFGHVAIDLILGSHCSKREREIVPHFYYKCLFSREYVLIPSHDDDDGELCLSQFISQRLRRSLAIAGARFCIDQNVVILPYGVR